MQYRQLVLGSMMVLMCPALLAGEQGQVLLISNYTGTDMAPASRISVTPGFLAAETLKFDSLSNMTLVQPESEVEYRFDVLGFQGEKDAFFIPLYRQASFDESTLGLDAWGVKWQHWLDSGNSFSVSAHYGDDLYSNSNLSNSNVVLENSTSTMASLSWTSQLSADGRSSVTSTVFLGDETAYGQDNRFERKYYGFSVDGRVTLFNKHTPYLSLKLQRSDYTNGDSAYWNGAEEDYHSRLAAGWNWQVQPNWSLRAQADYTFNDTEWGFHPNRSKIFFGTRYDFR